LDWFILFTPDRWWSIRVQEPHVRIVVDLNRCQTYAQCVFAAPTVFWLHGQESLEYDYAPDDALRLKVEAAAAACPVQAISIGRSSEQVGMS
jgi:ferredoxin